MARRAVFQFDMRSWHGLPHGALGKRSVNTNPPVDAGNSGITIRVSPTQIRRAIGSLIMAGAILALYVGVDYTRAITECSRYALDAGVPYQMTFIAGCQIWTDGNWTSATLLQ